MFHVSTKVPTSGLVITSGTKHPPAEATLCLLELCIKYTIKYEVKSYFTLNGAYLTLNGHLGLQFLRYGKYYFFAIVIIWMM